MTQGPHLFEGEGPQDCKHQVAKQETEAPSANFKGRQNLPPSVEEMFPHLTELQSLTGRGCHQPLKCKASFL